MFYQIKKKLLENKTLDITATYNQAILLGIAQRQSVSHMQPEIIGATLSASIPQVSNRFVISHLPRVLSLSLQNFLFLQPSYHTVNL